MSEQVSTAHGRALHLMPLETGPHD